MANSFFPNPGSLASCGGASLQVWKTPPLIAAAAANEVPAAVVASVQHVATIREALPDPQMPALPTVGTCQTWSLVERSKKIPNANADREPRFKGLETTGKFRLRGLGWRILNGPPALLSRKIGLSQNQPFTLFWGGRTERRVSVGHALFDQLVLASLPGGSALRKVRFEAEREIQRWEAWTRSSRG